MHDKADRNEDADQNRHRMNIVCIRIDEGRHEREQNDDQHGVGRLKRGRAPEDRAVFMRALLDDLRDAAQVERARAPAAKAEIDQKRGAQQLQAVKEARRCGNQRAQARGGNHRHHQHAEGVADG